MSITSMSLQALTFPAAFTSRVESAETLHSMADARWSADFSSYSWGAVALWVLLLIALQAISWPLVRRMFSRLPDRGWAFARPISILLGGLLVWYPASFGLIDFSTVWSIIGMLVVAAVSWLLVRRISLSPGERHWRLNPIAVTAEWVFWLTFTFFLLLRSLNPDSWHPFWGGEKPMEFAHLNAILRSDSFPPADPWYAGGVLNYYYFGTFLVANLIKITGIPAEIAFNLATPLFPAMLAATAFSICAGFGKRLTSSNFGAGLAGLAGVFFVQFAGNMIVATRLWDRAINKVTSPQPFVYWVWEPTRAIPDPARQINITEFPYFGALYADLHPHVIAMPYTLMVIALAWQIAASWRTVPLMFVRKRINMSHQLEILAPFALIGVVIGSLWMMNAWDMPMAVAIAVLGLTMMSIRVPSLLERFGIIAGGTIVIGIIAFITAFPFNREYESLYGDIGFTTDSTPLVALQSHLGAQLVICTLGAIVLLGYVRRAAVANVMLLRALGVAVVSGLILQWGLRGDHESLIYRIGEVLVVIGIVGIWTNIAWQSADEPNDFGIPVTWLQALSIVAMASSIWLLVFDYDSLALYLGIGLSAAVIWAGLERQSARFVAALIAAATLLGATLEIVYLVDDLNGSPWYRMNTIFKFYNQIWNLLGLACGVIVGIAIWRLLVWEEPITRRISRPAASLTQSSAIKLTAAISLPLMALMTTYVLVATPIRLDQRFGDGDQVTLNAYSWMEYGTVDTVAFNEEGEPINSPPLEYDDDLDAINWINENIDGTPVIAEAAIGEYRCFGSRYSVSTGLPAVIGWARHQNQQRPANDLTARVAEMRAFYTNSEASATDKRAFLDRYGVEYVIIGQMERLYPTIGDGGECVVSGNEDAIEIIESMEGTDLEIVYENEDTTIYRVIRDSN